MSAPSSSSGYAPDGPEEEDSSQIVSTTQRKPRFLQYPPDVPRMTRLGPCTFGVNTGPVADNADLTKLTLPMLEEQLGLRDIPDGGKKKDLIERLRNWKTCKPEIVAGREAPDRQVFGPISQNRSVTGNEKDYLSAAKKAMEESMYIIKQQDNYDGSPGLTVGVHSGSGSDNYQVTIGNKTFCNCSSIVRESQSICKPQSLIDLYQTYRPKSNCKHIIYVLAHILRAPAELLPQRTLFTEELMKLLDRAPKVRFTAAEVSTDPSMSDGVPKSKDGKCCPVCFKDIGEAQTACCGKCGNHTHSSCFDIYARELSG
ncbi:uncharacterized protein LY79DRAFT_668672 [Colletotrichum navitas]|uniref:SAP domain-containing protein n=1 Tax=Colletotrichum navitas TaxID=681940 RepID=A0AAD8V787_9PEZI|nr:uncharacterized protein LY79DRAFT_668672 [Colletotrichum navitas]KAK1594396.1 hypothetical protein LY79DRAFT_668672 [Colletotrichum navitas]